MANVLVVFTPRSGSTIISDLLAYKYNAINLDEMLDTTIRGVLYDKLPEDIKVILKEQSLLDLPPNPTSKKERDSYFYDTFNLYNKRFEFVKDTAQKYPIVVKYYPTAMLPGIGIVEWAIENNFELYFVSRRNFKKQLYSTLLAEVKTNFYKKAKKAGRLEIPEISGFLNTKGSLNVSFPSVDVPPEQVIEQIVKLTVINNMWKAYVNAYGKYGKVMYYEDTIVRGDYSLLDISPDLLRAYGKEEISLRPTHRYNVGDQISNWQEILEMAKQYEVPNLHE